MEIPFKDILENVTDGILVQDREFRCVFANEVGARMCGFPSAAALINAPVGEVLRRFEIRDEHGRPFPAERLPSRRTLNGETSLPDTLFQFKNLLSGQERWSRVTARPVLGENGLVKYAVSVIRDITDHRETERLARERQERLRLGADLARLGTWEYDARTCRLVCDEICLAHFGFRPGEFSDKQADFDARIHPEDEEIRRLARENAIRTGGFYSCEFRVIWPDGSIHWLASKGTTFYDEHGAPLRMVGSTVDNSERRNTERRLRGAESGAHLLAAAGSILASSLDCSTTLPKVIRLLVPELADLCFIDLLEEGGPPRTAAITHLDPEKAIVFQELRKRYPPDWSHDRGRPEVLRTGKSRIHPEISEEWLRERARDSDGFRLLRELKLRSVMYVPLMSAGGAPIGVITFIYAESERRYREEDLPLAEELARRITLAVENSRLYAKAEAQARELKLALQARDEFLSVASHELKTPLTSLKLHCQVYGRDLEAPDSDISPKVTSQFLETTILQVDRIAHLVDDMLDLSLINHGKFPIDPEELELGALAREMLERLANQARQAGCSLTLTAPEPVPGCWDRFRIEQVLSNLLTNAIKYAAGTPIEVAVAAANGMAELRVRDRGPGIAAENLERIFQRFERVVGGTALAGLGLGLYISRQIVLAHGGTIHAESRPGEGATFVVRLPR